MLARLGAQHLQAPAGDGAARRLGVPGMTRENGVEPLLLQEHFERLAQPEQQVGCWRVREKPGLPGFLHRCPIPVRARQFRVFRGGERLVGHRVEAEPRRQHQPLLRACDGDIDAPFVMAVVDRGERRNRIDHEQRRMACPIDGGADIGDAAGDSGRGFVVHDAHRLDPVLAIPGELLGHLRRVHTMPPIARHELDIEPQPCRHLPP